MKVLDWLLETESPQSLRKEIADLRKEVADWKSSALYRQTQLEDFEARYSKVYADRCGFQNDLKHCSRNLEEANFQIAMLRHELKKLKWRENANVANDEAKA